MTGHTRDDDGTERGQAAVIGIVLLLGLVAIGSIGILLVGSGAQEQTQERVNDRQVRVTFQQLDDTIDDVAAGTTENRNVDFDLPEGQALRQENTGQITITRTNLTTEQEVVVRNIGSLVYEENGRHYAYQAGAVWQGTGNATSIVSAPAISYQRTAVGSPTLTMSIIDLEGLQTVSTGGLQLSRTSTIAPMNNVSRFNNSLVTIRIQSDYYYGWGEYFDEQYDPIVVNYDHPNETAIVKIGRRNIPGSVDNAVRTGGNLNLEGGAGPVDGPATVGGTINPHPSSPDDCSDSDNNCGAGSPSMALLDSPIQQKIRQAEEDGTDVTAAIEAGNRDSSNPLDDPNTLYYANGFELNGDELEFDLSSGNVTLVVDGPIAMEAGGHIDIRNANQSGSDCCFARIYIGGGPDGKSGDISVANGVTDTDGSTAFTNIWEDGIKTQNASRFQIYGTSEMHFNAGQSADFNALIYAPHDGPPSGDNEAGHGSGAPFPSIETPPSATGSCTTESACIGTGSGGLNGAIIGFNNVGVSSSAGIHFDEDIRGVDLTMGSSGVVPPPITYLHVGVRQVCVGGGDCNPADTLTADLSYSPSAPDPGETVTLDASNSHIPEGSISQYDWYLDGDGTYEVTAGGATQTQSWSSGTHTVGVKIYNGSGGTDTTTRTITVSSNSAPTAQAAANRTTIAPGEDVELFDDGSTDSDGSIASYEWDVDEDGTYERSGTSFVESFSSTTDVTLKVTDDDGATDTETLTITVSNDPPNADFSQNRTNPAPGEDVKFDASLSSDPDGDSLTYEWDLDDDGSYDDATGLTVTHSWSSTGTYDVGLRVTDPYGESDTKTVSVTVSNDPPTADFSQNRTNPAPGEDVRFDASSSSDPDGDSLTYEWDLDDDGSYDDATGPTAVRDWSSAGNYDVDLRVSDPHGGSDTKTVTVSVGSVNDPPTAAVTANRTSVRPGQDVELFDDGSTDSDGSIDSYEWDVDDDGTYEKTGSSIVESFGSSGDHDVTLRVTDDDGATDTATVTVSVNAPPDAAFTYSPSVPGTGESVTFTYSGSGDSDGTIASYEWDVDDDGTYEKTGSSVSHSFGSAGDHDVTLRVTDDDGATKTTTKTVSVNAPPSAAFTYSPSSPNTGDSVSFSYSGSGDPDGDSLTYEWDVDGDGTYEETGSSATHSYSSAGDYGVTLRVTDEHGATNTTTETVSVSSSPQPPTFDSTSVTDNSKTTGPPWTRDASYDVSYSVSDPAGSPAFDRVEVTFDWSSGGSTTKSSSLASDTISYSNSANGDSFTITVELYDDTGSVVECREYTDTADDSNPSSYTGC